MAEGTFQVQIAAIHNDSRLKDQQDVFVERTKAEDDTFIRTNVEVEHFLMLRYEEALQEQQQSQQQDDVAQVEQAFARFEEQPMTFGSWSALKRQEWYEK